MSETFAALLAAHHARYPLLQPQDYVKLAWQAAFGPAHLLQIGEDEIQAQLTEEWQAVPLGSTPPDCEPVGGELVRFPLRAGQGTRKRCVYWRVCCMQPRRRMLPTRTRLQRCWSRLQHCRSRA